MAEPALNIETDDEWAVSDRRDRDLMFQSQEMSNPVVEPVFPSSRGKLTKAEIEALLRPDLPEDFGKEPAPEATSERTYETFEADPPESENRDEEDGKAIAAALSLGLRQDCELPAAVRVAQIYTGNFGEAFEGAWQGSACLFFRGPDGTISVVLTISSGLTASLIDLACGGEGSPGGISGRALTALDSEMLEALLAPLALSLGEGYQLARTEIDTRFASAMVPPGKAEIIDLTFTLAALEAPARLAILHEEEETKETRIALEDVSAGFATACLTARIASLSVPVSRLSNLKPGATLMLGIPADQPVELLSGGRDGVVAAEGEIGRKGNAIAVRVTRRGHYLRKVSRKAKEQL